MAAHCLVIVCFLQGSTPTVKFNNVTYSFSGFTYGRTFTFEYVYDVDEYSYEVADKNSTYILASLSISTKENSAPNPRVYACEIVDGSSDTTIIYQQTDCNNCEKDSRLLVR